MTLKEKLFSYCLEYTELRITEAKQSIEEAREASRSETKSSAGDKYETARAMMQQEIDRNQAQMHEASKLKTMLNHIGHAAPTDTAQAGSIVLTGEGNFYIAISAGKTEIDGVTYHTISPASPLGQKLAGLKAGMSLVLNGKSFQIERVL